MREDPSGGIAHPMDIALGKRLKLLRQMAGISQEDVALECGVTFQMIQKYERGVTRISYSRLTEFAKALNMSVRDIVKPLDDLRSSATPDYIDLLSTPLAADMLRIFSKVKSREKRKRAIDVIKLLLEDQQEN